MDVQELIETQQNMKIVVIGAAPTGLGVAYRLHELQQSNEAAKKVDIILLERESFAGGLSRTEKDEKGFLWDMGVHITFSHNYPYYFKALKWAHDDWNSITRNCKVDISHMFNEEGVHLVPYPAQFAVHLFPEEAKKSAVAELKERYENVWTVETEELNPIWVGTRVAKVSPAKLDQLCAMSQHELAQADFGWGPNATFIFPKHGGTGTIWKAMAAKLPQNWFRFNCEVRSRSFCVQTILPFVTAKLSCIWFSLAILNTHSSVDFKKNAASIEKKNNHMWSYL
ncbi:unnamed protein product [Toxocara canis]|uniref:Amino_oxidase domain-containing protein n=1 Tax=Toxocara canis TaxID=6265 RepID=A0A183V4N6_TOXCA|nr:unnamed protein product [Toxocara canis]